MTLPDGRMQHIVYTSDSSSMEYRDNYSRMEQAMEGDKTHGSYKVTLPDGRMQSVEYSSAGGGGYKARVEYRDKHSHYSRS